MEFKSSPDWTELPRELLIDIFSRLSIVQIWNGPMLVCKTWNNTSSEPSVYSVFDLEDWFLSSTGSINWWTSEFEEIVDLTLMSVADQREGGLKEVRVRHCTDQSLSYVAERCPNLEVLWVKYCPKVTVESMSKIALNCPNLKELDISCCYEISGECMELVGKNCKNLQILKRNLMDPLEITILQSEVVNTNVQRLHFDAIGNVEACAIGRQMSQLKYLELRFSTMIDKALRNICDNCSNIEYLDLFGCSSLTSDGVTNHTSRLKNLKEIKTPNFTALL